MAASVILPPVTKVRQLARTMHNLMEPGLSESPNTITEEAVFALEAVLASILEL